MQYLFLNAFSDSFASGNRNEQSTLDSIRCTKYCREAPNSLKPVQLLYFMTRNVFYHIWERSWTEASCVPETFHVVLATGFSMRWDPFCRNWILVIVFERIESGYIGWASNWDRYDKKDRDKYCDKGDMPLCIFVANIKVLCWLDNSSITRVQTRFEDYSSDI